MLAPMAGVTDNGYRKICRKYGADVTVSEMVSSKGIFYKDKKSTQLLHFDCDEEPIVLQIFGHDPDCMKYAAEFVTNNYSPIGIDINMGCPAPKIFQNGDGSALMKNHDLASKVIIAVKQNTNLPVSVKFRSGIDEAHICAVEFAKMCEESGADYITIHGRTREQFYSGVSDIEIIKKVVKAVTIPVVANGDIKDAASARHMLNYTGAHSLMIGRASLGNPLVFNEIKNIRTNCNLFDIAVEHIESIKKYKPETVAIKEFRKHLIWYLKGVKNAAEYKRSACEVNTTDDCINLLNHIKENV